MVAPKGTFQTHCLALGMGKVEIKDRESRKGMVFASLWKLGQNQTNWCQNWTSESPSRPAQKDLGALLLGGSELGAPLRFV